MLEWIFFFTFSICILWISRKSLRVPGSHGFFRFFAWECILGLFLLNVRVWFKNPGSWHQLISWGFLVISLLPLALGVRGLTRRGRPTSQREGEPQLLAFEKTSQLVTTGVYRYIRHPLYSSLLLLTWGIFFKNISWQAGLLALLSTLFLYLTARADEAECMRFFGPEYQEYMKHTRRFVPFLF
jgi:protein-S-isoprenylcysteine O-methyltransferase Ste14